MESTKLLAGVLTMFFGLAGAAYAAETRAPTATGFQAGAARSFPVTHDRHAYVDGGKISYREAGPASGPTAFPPQGLPTSSYMFQRGRTLLTYVAAGAPHTIHATSTKAIARAGNLNVRHCRSWRQVNR